MVGLDVSTISSLSEVTTSTSGVQSRIEKVWSSWNGLRVGPLLARESPLGMELTNVLEIPELSKYGCMIEGVEVTHKKIN